MSDRNAPDLKGDLDFSFSGLKTAVLRYVRAHDGPLTEPEIADVAATFQRIVVANLIDRLFDAGRRYQARSVGIAGGVSANSRLRAELKARGERREMPTFVPSLQLSTDNAAMIAAAGLRKLRAGHHLGVRHQRRRGARLMTVFTDYLWFNTKSGRSSSGLPTMSPTS